MLEGCRRYVSLTKPAEFGFNPSKTLGFDVKKHANVDMIVKSIA